MGRRFVLEIQDGGQITGSTNNLAGFTDIHVVLKAIQGFMYETSKSAAIMQFMSLACMQDVVEHQVILTTLDINLNVMSVQTFCCDSWYYTVSQKTRHQTPVRSFPNIDQFSKFFRCYTR